MPALTQKQKEILDFIKNRIDEHEVSPTLEEISKHFHKAIGTVHEHVAELVKKGLLKKTNSARGIEMVKNHDAVEIPLKGFIAAGLPMEALEEYETVAVPKNLLSRFGEHYALRVRGDSMIGEGIFDGDNVIIRKQNTAENGETVVALLNDNEATLKKIYKIKEGFKLLPANPALSPIIVRQLIIQGKVISVMRNYEARKNLAQPLNLWLFTENLRGLLTKAQIEIRQQLETSRQIAAGQQIVGDANGNKFCLETAYTFFNELILLWVCKDKQLLNFETMETNQQLTALKGRAQKIYFHIFADNIFDWYKPSDWLLQQITNDFNKYDFADINRDVLGKLYEQFISHEERKKLGQFYTPEAVIDYILDQTGYAGDIENKKIIDIACGSGGFLTRAANRLIKTLKNKHCSNSEIIEKATNNIYGLDVNPFACYLAETNILIQLLDAIIEAKRENPQYNVPKIKIFQTNTVETPSLLSPDGQEVKNIKNRVGEFADGFDFVVGNPPYLEAKKMDKKIKELCRAACPNVANGAFDLFVCFIDKGLRLLKDGGQFGYIIPNKFLIAGYAKKMREEILNKYAIKEIIDVSECEIFQNVSVYPVIVIIANTKPDGNVIATAERVAGQNDLVNRSFAKSEIRQDIYNRDDFAFFILPADKKQNGLLRKLLSEKYKALENYLTIKWAISFHAAGLREKFLFPAKPESQYAKKIIGGKSFAGNDDVNRYKLKWGGWWIDYNQELAKQHKNQLPPPKMFEQEKIIICQNALRLRAAYDDKEFYCKDTFFTAVLNDNIKSRFELKFFLALLNSKLLHYYYANIYKGTHVAGGYLHYLVGYLNGLPIAEPTKKQQSEIVALTGKIMQTENENQFNKIDERIDGLIYKLYGLEDEQVKIVENFV